MKKNAIMFSFCVVSMSINAQEPSTAKKSKEASDLKKNELSINTAPLFSLVLGMGPTNVTRFSTSYKRNLNKHNALRFSILADKVDSRGYSERTRDEEVVFYNNNTMIKQITVSPGYISPQLRIGYERLFGGERLKWFYGGDMGIGYSKNHSYKENIMLSKDSINGGWMEKDFAATIVSRTQSKTITIGFSPFFGAKYNFSKHFAVSAQSGFDLSFRHTINTVINTTSTNTYGFSSFDFREGDSIISDVSLIYKL